MLPPPNKTKPINATLLWDPPRFVAIADKGELSAQVFVDWCLGTDL